MPALRTKIPAILLFGTLSVFFAEVLSGASTLWFIDGWGLLMVLPLYLGHALFFLNLAIRTKRTTPHHLYYWGILFALYEALITKVLWYGFPNSTSAIFPEITEIAVMEFTILTFFWHPIMAFILPIFIYELLSNDYLPGHKTYLIKNKTTLPLIIFFTILGASFQSNGAQYNLQIALGAIIGTLLIIFILNYLSKEKKIQSLTIGKPSLISLTIYLLALYSFTTLFLLPERLPTNPISYLIILSWYLLIIALLIKDKKTTSTLPSSTQPLIDRPYILLFFILIIILTILFCTLTSLGQPLILAYFFGITIFGIIIFIKNITITIIHTKKWRKK